MLRITPSFSEVSIFHDLMGNGYQLKCFVLLEDGYKVYPGAAPIAGSGKVCIVQEN